MNFLLLLLVALLAGLAPRPASAQPRRDLLLVVNANSAESVKVGEHYAQRRGLPDDAVLRLQVAVADEIPRDEYLARIEAPVSAWFGRHSAQDRVRFVVLTRGVPLRVAGTAGRAGTVASVDSELALLYRKMTGRQTPVQGFVPNPYFAGATAPAEWRPFSHEQHDVFLVTRIDGYTAADATALVDHALSARPARDGGRIVLDMKAAVDDKGNEWLRLAAERLAQMGLGDRVELEQTSAVVRDQKDLLAYYSWGSNDPAIRDRDLGNRFLPGAIAGQFVSTDARTFTEPAADWKIGTWEQRASFFAGSPQSLTGDLIRQGVTGVSGQVAEPFLDGSIRPEILIPAYLAGFTLAEAYYLAMPYLGWQTVVVGDPLTTVATLVAPPVALEPGTDSSTELPAWFSKRRLESATSPGLKPDAVAAWVRAGTRSARGDAAGARAALEEAVALDTKVTGAHLLLATMYDQAGELAKAEAAYRAVLASDPRSVLALNNLAYLLAVRQKKPADGLPLAERAHVLAPGVGNIADTLAWVHYLLGNKAQAGRYIADALRTEPNNAEVRLHAAAILLDAGDLEGAKREYAKALELDGAIADRDEAKAVAGRLK